MAFAHSVLEDSMTDGVAGGGFVEDTRGRMDFSNVALRSASSDFVAPNFFNDLVEILVNLLESDS